MKIQGFTKSNIQFRHKVDDKNNPPQKNVCLSYPASEHLRAYIGCGKIHNINITGENMSNKEKYITIRENFSKDLAPKLLETELNAWEFYINSTDENMQKYLKSENDTHELFKNEDLYSQLKDIKNTGLNDRHLDKQLKDLYKSFDEELNAGDLKKALREKENEIAAKYNAYVPMIDGKEVTKADISKILETEKNPDVREKAYNAKVKGGDIIADDIKDLVKLRNEFAKSQGYDNFYDYQLKEEYDVEPKELDTLLDNVYESAKPLNTKLRQENQQELANVFNIQPEELKAFHYGLLSDKNPAKEVNKQLKTKEQVVDIGKSAYQNMGFDLDNMNITLDLFPRKNKNTHGFCFEIEPGKDSRILANLTNNTNSLDTICHELGHCVYNLGIDTELPYLDRGTTPAMTEAVAVMMGDLAQRENILKDVVQDDALEKFKNDYKKSEAKFINRSMMIINFEKEMYKNPDQDLGQLWHDMKCKYTGRNESEGVDNEWATIPHYLSHPGYYQNYFRADLIKAQMYNHLTDELGPITENKHTAEYLNEHLFRYGKSIEEDELIEKFTGQKLSADALCNSLQLDN